MYAAALQVCELQRGSLSGLKGRYVKAAVYHICLLYTSDAADE